MEINKLNQEELAYELKVRGLPAAKVEEMRVTLREALRAEKDGHSMAVEPYPFSFAEDVTVLEAKLKEVEELIANFSGDPTCPEYKKIITKIGWAQRRLARSKPKGDQQKTERQRLKARFFFALGSLRLKAGDEEDTNENPEDTANLSMSAAVVNSVASCVPLYKWDVKFSGDPSQSLNSFLERVDELATARGVTHCQLFRSALDLFSGRALLWYRANKAKFNSWQHLVKELKREFLPPDYDERLLEEIRKRTQGKDETIGMYVTVMINMFSRLNEPLPENQQLKIIKRNVSPFYQTQLALVDVETIQGLIDLGRRLEAVRNSVEAFAPPPSRKHVHLLEPDLAYVASDRAVVATVMDRPAAQNVGRNVKCFRCGRRGHLSRFCRVEIRCYGCGVAGVVRSRCTNCSNTSQNQSQPNPQPQRSSGQQANRGNRGQGHRTSGHGSDNPTSGNASRARQ